MANKSAGTGLNIVTVDVGKDITSGYDKPGQFIQMKVCLQCLQPPQACQYLMNVQAVTRTVAGNPTHRTLWAMLEVENMDCRSVTVRQLFSQLRMLQETARGASWSS